VNRVVDVEDYQRAQSHSSRHISVSWNIVLGVLH